MHSRDEHHRCLGKNYIAEFQLLDIDCSSVYDWGCDGIALHSFGESMYAEMPLGTAIVSFVVFSGLKMWFWAGGLWPYV